MCNGVSLVEDKVEEVTTIDNRKHTGLPGRYMIGQMYTTYCGIIKPVETLGPLNETKRLLTCPTCALKHKSFYGY